MVSKGQLLQHYCRTLSIWHSQCVKLSFFFFFFSVRWRLTRWFRVRLHPSVVNSASRNPALYIWWNTTFVSDYNIILHDDSMVIRWQKFTLKWDGQLFFFTLLSRHTCSTLIQCLNPYVCGAAAASQAVRGDSHHRDVGTPLTHTQTPACIQDPIHLAKWQGCLLSREAFTVLLAHYGDSHTHWHTHITAVEDIVFIIENSLFAIYAFMAEAHVWLFSQAALLTGNGSYMRRITSERLIKKTSLILLWCPTMTQKSQNFPQTVDVVTV